MRLIVLFALHLGALGVLGLPLFLQARRRGRSSTIRNFAWVAVGIAALLAVTSYTSEVAVARCEAAGNTACFDPGSTGMIILFHAAFAVVAWARAWNLLGR